MKQDLLTSERESGEESSHRHLKGERATSTGVSRGGVPLSAGGARFGAGDSVNSLRQDVRAFRLTPLVEPLFVHRWTLILSLFLAGLACWVALLVWPRSYQSEAKLQLLVGRESVGLDPSSTTTQTLLMQKTLEEDVNSALEILGSRDVAEHVVNELGAEAVLSGYLPAAGTGDRSGLAKWSDWAKATAVDGLLTIATVAGIRDSVNDEERAVLWLRDNVSVHAPKKSSTMIVSAESKSPEMAQAIVNSYTKHFIDRHVNVSTTEGSHQFFGQQAAQAETELTDMMRRRSELLQQNKMVSASARFAALTTQQATIEATILSTVAQIKQSKSELADLDQRIGGLELETVSGTQTAPDATISGMRLALYTLELEQQNLSLKYQAGHWRLRQIEDRVESARSELAKLEQESQSLSMAPNPLRQKLEEDILRAQTRIVGLESLLQESEQQLAEKQREINELLNLELQLEQMDREIEVAKKNLALLREKEEQSRVVENLRQQRISSVGIAQAASLDHKPAKPNKIVIIAASLAAGLGLGLGLVALREVARKTFRHADDFERLMGYPVLAEVPYLSRLARGPVQREDFAAAPLAGLRQAGEDAYAELVLAGVANSDLPRARLLGVLGVDNQSGGTTFTMLLGWLHLEASFQRTTLVDLDAQNATLSRCFDVVGQPGIVQLGSAWADAARPLGTAAANASSRSTTVAAVVQETGLPAVSVARQQLAVLEQVAAESDLVIVDFPSACRPSPTLGLAAQMDAMVLVVEAERTTAESVARVLRQIERAGGVIAGVILTKSRRVVPRWLENILG